MKTSFVTSQQSRVVRAVSKTRFFMVGCLSLLTLLATEATAIDTVKPTVVITSPMAAQRIAAMSPYFTVRGTARDIGLGVTEVWCQINSGTFVPASGTNVWSCPVMLTEGLNKIRAYSRDAAGNYSPTQTVSCTYVPTTPIGISKTGNGTVGIYTNGQPLEIGRTYILTATPAAGFKLLNWTKNDIAAGTSASLSFLMQPNLTVCANFIDIGKPTVVIASPTAAQRIVALNPDFTVRGTARDIGAGVTEVWCQINNDTFVPASGTNVWSCPVTLTEGLNKIRAYSRDAAGNCSPTQTVSCTYVVTRPIGISMTGLGKVGVYTNGQPLEIGRTYTLTATPALGFKLLNWTYQGADIPFFYNGNIGAVLNGPTSPTVFTLATATTLSSLQTYHWNGGRGKSPLGTLSLSNSNGTVHGPWSVTGYPGQNGVSNAYWKATPNILLDAGTYTIIDSDPSTWSRNASSLGKGFAWANKAEGVATTPSFTFSMQSNLTVRANFIDIGKPVVAITAPTWGQRITAGSQEFTVRGTARDIGAGVTEVWCQLNNGAWQMAAGTNAWTHIVTLEAGPNTIKAYSKDAAGNSSPTQTVSCTYVATTPIRISKTGNGTVGSYTDGQLLEIGRAYTLTATPALGFKLLNWTMNDNVAGTALSFTFIMQPNLTVCANFIDTAKPTVVITSPTAAQRIVAASPEFTVLGKAGDIGLGVASVWCQLNSEGFVAVSGTNAWSCPVTLTAGLNTIKAYSMDAEGNSSLTQTVSCTYVVTTPIGISKTGNGTVGSYTDGQLLEIGRSYTLTATPAAGFKLLNWTVNGNVEGTSASLSFVMQPNLTVCANFIDTAKPTVAITSPTAAQRIVAASPDFTVLGKAGDIGLGVASVWCQLNSDDFVAASGTDAWSCPVTLTAGLNTIKAYSMDAEGNCSLTQTVSCTYVVTTPIGISKTGMGSVGIYTNGQPLEIGRAYTLTATPATGFVLRNWTTNDIAAGTGLSFSFIMQSNLTVCANFVDTGKPVVAITAPTAGQRITVASPEFTVRGTAGDIGAGVASVWCQLNSDGFVVASGTDAWSCPVTLTAGLNTIKAYSMDEEGNCSLTQTVSCTYVVATPIGISKTGNGTVGVYTDGQLLEIGRTYTLTATPATGFGLRNWTTNDIVAGTGLSFTFIMQPNLTVCANFVDTGKPVVAITAPTAGQRITAASPDFTVRGTASDIGAGVVAVECQINNGEWQTATGLNAWTNIVTLVAGPNTIKAYSRDAAGNSSPTASVVCTYVVTTPIGISKTGLGTVGVYTNGQLLEIGTSYTLTATPATGSVLRNWTTNDNVAGTALSLTFIMKSNLTVCANFIEKANLNELTDAGLNALSEFVNTNSLTRGQAELVASAAADFDLVARNNPNNYTNRIYNAVAIMLNLINDPVVRSQAAAFGLNLNDLFDPTCVFPTVMPSVDITVDNLAASVLPAVDKAYTELNAVPATWTGMFEISPDKFPIDEAVWIDIGDVTAMKAALKGLRAFVGLLKAYNLNVDYRSLYDPTATPQAPIVVDGSDADWTNVTASLSSVNMADNSLMVTQEVAVALDQNQIALLMKGCPFVPADTFRIYFTLRLSNGDGLNSNRIFTVEMLSDSQVFGAKFNGQQFDNFEMKLVNGVLEVKFPIPDMLETSQVTVEVVEGTWSWGEMAFELEFPRDVPIKTIRANQPEFFSKVRNTTSLAAAKPDLLEALNGYLAADTLIVNRSGISTQLLHFVDFDVNDPAAVEDQQNKKFAVQSIRASLSGAVQVEGDSYIEGTVTRPVYLGAFFNAPYITTNIFPSGLRGTINNPVYDVFPDPTFHGILPGMTSVKLDKYLFGYTYASVETTTIIQDGENYPELNFYVDTDRMFMVITNVTVSGPSIPLPGMNLNWNGMSNDWNLRIPFTMPTKPGVGSVYTVTVYFSDGSQEQIERPITAWLAFSSTPTLSGSTLRWPAVTGAARYEVVDLVNDQSFEIPATQTSLDLSLYGYEPGYIPYLWIQAVDANWNSAGCMLNILE